MSTGNSRDELIAALESSVRDTLAYFEGPGLGNPARIDRWGSWEVLAHFPYWHYATTWGIESAATGGPPWLLSGTADQINDACLALHAGERFDDLSTQLRLAQTRLLRAARQAEDLDAPAFRRPDGQMVTVRQRLETIARHWRGHLDALVQADGR
jgi:hypothetical protein